MQAIAFLLDAVASFFCTLFLLRFMMQAMRVSFAGQIGDFVVKLTNWAVKPLRGFIPGLGGYDWAFEQKLPSTKITVHLVDEGLDTGKILAQGEVDLRGADTLAEVERRGLAIEHQLYPDALGKYLKGFGQPCAES